MRGSSPVLSGSLSPKQLPSFFAAQLQRQAEQIVEANVSFDERQRHREGKLAQIAASRDDAAAERAEYNRRVSACVC